MMQTCVEGISENLDHSISSILKDTAYDVIPFRALLHLTAFIDTSTSEGSMDGGSMVNLRKK